MAVRAIALAGGTLRLLSHGVTPTSLVTTDCRSRRAVAVAIRAIFSWVSVMTNHSRSCTELLAVLRAHEAEPRARGVETITLIGSLARGEATDASDVDLAIRPSVGFSSGGFDHFARLEELREMLATLLHCDVDLVEEPGVRPRLKDVIEREGVRAFQSPVVAPRDWPDPRSLDLASVSERVLMRSGFTAANKPPMEQSLSKRGASDGQGRGGGPGPGGGSEQAAERAAVEPIAVLEVGVHHGVAAVAAETFEPGEMHAEIHAGAQRAALEAVTSQGGRVEARAARARSMRATVRPSIGRVPTTVAREVQMRRKSGLGVHPPGQALDPICYSPRRTSR